jgi:hypothetical protein
VDDFVGAFVCPGEVAKLLRELRAITVQGKTRRRDVPWLGFHFTEINAGGQYARRGAGHEAVEFQAKVAQSVRQADSSAVALSAAGVVDFPDMQPAL